MYNSDSQNSARTATVTCCCGNCCAGYKSHVLCRAREFRLSRGCRVPFVLNDVVKSAWNSRYCISCVLVTLWSESKCCLFIVKTCSLERGCQTLWSRLSSFVRSWFIAVETMYTMNILLRYSVNRNCFSLPPPPPQKNTPKTNNQKQTTTTTTNDEDTTRRRTHTQVTNSNIWNCWWRKRDLPSLTVWPGATVK